MTRAEILQAIVDKTNLSKANLRGANLSGADLRGADLRKANLRGANQAVIRIQGSRDEINAIDEDVRIGCMRHPLTQWLLHFDKIGNTESYTEAEIAEYHAYLIAIQAVLDARKWIAER